MISAPAQHKPLLRVEDLTKSYPAPGSSFSRQRALALNNLSFSIAPGEVYGLVGESGSGKSTCGRLICGLERPDAGNIFFRGHDLTQLSRRDRKQLQTSIQLVFQDSATAFDPRYRVGSMLEEAQTIAGEKNHDLRRQRALEWLGKVGLSEEHYQAFPHELSGGQRQRLNLARALICEPELVVCDEPVSALDVSVQAQILNLLKDLQATTGVALLFITHDMRVVRHMADRMGVLQNGTLVEEGPTLDLIAHPTSAYAQALIDAIPR